MRSAYTFDSSYRASGRRRAPSLLLALGVIALVALLLLRLAPPLMPPVPPAHPPATFTLSPDASPAPAQTRRRAARERQAGSGSRERPSVKPPTQQQQQQQQQAADVPDASAWPSGVMIVDKGVFAASDVGRIPRSPGAASGNADAETADSGTPYGPGEGPGGARLYTARWYREPSDAELATYLPAAVAKGSWAEIACQTTDRYHVENCRALRDFPAGSRLANAMRQAAWQFLVRPPSVGGKPIMGAWVRIRIDFTDKGTQ